MVFAALVLVGVWLVRATPWSADAAGRGSDRGIADPGLNLYPAGERDPAPPLEGRTLDDTPFNLEDLDGHVVVINVWGSWCGPCRAETPGLVRIANKTADEGVRFVGIDTRDDRAAAQAFVKNYKVPYPSVFDPTGQALLAFRDVIPSAAIPSSLVLDADGNVAARVIGAVDETTLQGLLDDLLAEDGNATGDGS
jgi:thiol-disulfide isomerase/thioredoxin